MKILGKKPPSPPLEIDQELQKIQSQIDAVSDQLSDAALELGTSVRLSVERRELEAYARGIRFAMGEGPPWG